MGRPERAPMPFEVGEEEPSAEPSMDELTLLEHPDATVKKSKTQAMRRKEDRAAEQARREAHRRLGLDPQGELFPER